MIGTARWKKAQEAEQKYWLEDAEKKFARDDRKMLYYQDRALGMKRWIGQALGGQVAHHRLLEIGSGPLGVCGFWDAKEKYALDPLENLYGSKQAFIPWRAGADSARRTSGIADGRAS